MPRVINIHKRTIPVSQDEIAALLDTLSTEQDLIWPHEKWPRMKFKEGLKLGARGGHGPIRYSVQKYIQGKFIEFEFLKPEGLNGYHRLEIMSLSPQATEIKHTIEINPSLGASLAWIVWIRYLHDALIEDAFDKVENHFKTEEKKSNWNVWVKTLRWVLT